MPSRAGKEHVLELTRFIVDAAKARADLDQDILNESRRLQGKREAGTDYVIHSERLVIASQLKLAAARKLKQIVDKYYKEDPECT